MSDAEKITEKSTETETETKQTSGNQSTTWLKLVAVLAILFVAIKYGQPLMQKFASSASEKLDERNGKKEDSAETTANNAAVPPVKPKKSTVKITSGYEAWEPEIRKQLEEWIERGVSYELIRVSVNDAKTMMEIDYRTIKGDVRTRQPVIILKKDGFDGRFILRQEDKEFVVYPPEHS